MSVITIVLFCFVIFCSSSFGVSGRRCFVFVARVTAFLFFFLFIYLFYFILFFYFFIFFFFFFLHIPCCTVRLAFCSLYQTLWSRTRCRCCQALILQAPIQLLFYRLSVHAHIANYSFSFRSFPIFTALCWTVNFSFRKFHTHKKNWYQYVTFAKCEIFVWSISINFGV